MHDLKNASRKVAIHFVRKVGKLHFDFFLISLNSSWYCCQPNSTQIKPRNFYLEFVSIEFYHLNYKHYFENIFILLMWTFIKLNAIFN